MPTDDVIDFVSFEQAFLGACLTDQTILEDATVVGADFDNPLVGRVFDRARERLAAGEGVSQALLAEDFPDQMRMIWGTTDYVNEVALADHHERTIHEHSMRRRLKSAAIYIAGIADGNETDRMVERARAELDGIESVGSHIVSMRDDMREVMADFRKQVDLVPSPWAEVNGTIGGFGPGRMYVFGARPGVGKSALAAQAAYTLALGGAVIFATMEMDKAEVYGRILSQQAEVYYGGLKATASDFIRAREEAWTANEVRDIRVIDKGTQSVASIRSAVRSVQRETPVAGVVVDYIHLMTASGGASQNEVNRIAEITRGLKQLAMDFKIPVIALSQLNRNVSGRIDPKPTLADLRGSGSIEQDSDVVIFLYRDTEVSGRNQDQVINVHVGKNRQGPSNVDLELVWQGDFVRAVDR